MSIEVLDESGADVDVKRAGPARAASSSTGCGSTRRPSCASSWSTRTPSPSSTSSGWTRRARPTCSPSRWTSCGPGWSTRSPRRASSATSCCARRSPSGRPSEARAKGQAGYTTADEVDLLTVHGILHLLGYDHAEPEEHAEMFGLQARLLAEWQGVRAGEPARRRGRDAARPRVTCSRYLAAGRSRRCSSWSRACSAAPTPRWRRSRRCAPRSCSPRARAAPRRLLTIAEDPPRYLNTALFLRMLCEIAAIVLVTEVVLDLIAALERPQRRRPSLRRGRCDRCSWSSVRRRSASGRARSAGSTPSGWRCSAPAPWSSSPGSSARCRSC